MLLTDRFLSSHRLEWLCLFLGCGLGQWLVLNARCLTAGETHNLQDAGVASRGRCSLNGVIGVFPLDQRENLMTCHLILLKSPVISMMSRQFGVVLVFEQTVVGVEGKNGLFTYWRCILRILVLLCE